MASPTAVASGATAVTDSPSDYGSDLDEEIVLDLLAEIEGVSVEPLVLEPLEDHESQQILARVPLFSSQVSTKTEGTQYFSALEEQSTQLDWRKSIPEYSTTDTNGKTSRSTLAQDVVTVDDVQGLMLGVEKEAEVEDNRSPLERFRRPPKKPLSVTDIVSPAWCELQYWYSLTKYGKIKRTPAMKQGSRVHQDLEAQVHDVVPVAVETREDVWGLRIWNVVQGLRTLRATGLTRELEIWGILDGEVINGVIDELSYICPDPDLELGLEASKQDPVADRPPNQLSIEDFFVQRSAGINATLTNAAPPPKIYLTDIKTRTANTLPRGAALKTVQLQLQLYHHLLSALAHGTVPRSAIFSRYGLDSTAPFSTAMTDALTALESTSTDNTPSSTATPSASRPEPHQPNTLISLWDLMQAEFAQTLCAGPASSPSATTLSPLLRAEFRAQADGAVLGSRVFVADDEALARYVGEALRWWRGERAPRGVDVEDAFKCRVCEFAEGCEWRVGKVEEAVRRSRMRWRKKATE